MEGGDVLPLVRAEQAYSRFNRQRKAQFAIDVALRQDVQSVLLVGVSRRRTAGDPRVPGTNLIENRLIESFPRVVASGMAPAGEGWPEYVCADGRDLPFSDGSFDLVYSNAVIEHVGGLAEQRRFVQEHDRVGRNWILTTPNRLFPVEAHTFSLVRHMNPNWRPPRPVYTRLLSKSDLRDLMPAGARIRGSALAPTLTAFGLSEGFRAPLTGE